MFTCPETLSLPVLLGTTGKANWQCPAPGGFSHTSTKGGKRLLLGKTAAFLKTNIPLSSLSLTVVNIAENVVNPVELQKIPQTLTPPLFNICLLISMGLVFH